MPTVPNTVQRKLAEWVRGLFAKSVPVYIDTDQLGKGHFTFDAVSKGRILVTVDVSSFDVERDEVVFVFDPIAGGEYKFAGIMTMPGELDRSWTMGSASTADEQSTAKIIRPPDF